MKESTAKVLAGPIGYLVVGAVTVGAVWYLIKHILPTKTPEALKPLSNAIADAYTALTFSPPVQVLGQIQFPDGSMAAVSDIASNSGIDDSFGFTYMGRHWTLGPRDSNGNYQASPS